jgi:hypothetical protein
VPSGIDNFGTRGFRNLGVDCGITGLEKQNIVPEPVKFQGECHADRARADDTELTFRLIRRELLNEH